jgi:hypothetical protein
MCYAGTRTMFCHAESQDPVRTSSPLTWWYVVPPEVGLDQNIFTIKPHGIEVANEMPCCVLF